MKKVIYVLLFIVVIALLLRGCGESETKVTFDKIESDLPELQEFEFDAGIVSGEDEERTLSFEPFEVKPGLILDRKINVSESQGVEWNLSFESTSFEGEYVHVENIPKSFVQDVSQIEFSIEPDVIIDADPSVAWIMSVSAGLKTSLKMKIGVEYFLGGKDAAIMSAVENFDDVRLFVGLERCRFVKSDYGRLLCMIDLIGKNPKKFTLEHCKGLTDFKQVEHEEGIAEMQACRAFLKNDITECENYDVYDEAEYSSGHCKKHAFLTSYASCLDETEEIHKDYCIQEKAVWSGYAEGCSKISNILPYQYCIAEVNQDDDACVKLMEYEDMFSEDDYVSCCNLLKEDAYRSRCVEYVSDEKESVKSTGLDDVCTASDDEYYLSMCYKNEAKKTCDVNYCLMIERQRDQDECVLAMDCGVDDCLAIDGNYRIRCIWSKAKTPEECALIGGEEYNALSTLNQVYNQETCNTRERMNTDDLERWRESLRNRGE